jgi:hypothetical protein
LIRGAYFVLSYRTDAHRDRDISDNNLAGVEFRE